MGGCLSIGMDDMGMTTLSSSSSVKVGGSGEEVSWSLSVGAGVAGCEGCVGASGVFDGVTGDGSCDGRVGAFADEVSGTLGLRRGERRGGVGLVVRPGVLCRVIRLWRRGVMRRMRGAVGLLDRVGSTLGGGKVWVSTLGDCW